MATYKLVTAPGNAFEPAAVFQFFDTTTGVLTADVPCSQPPLFCSPLIYTFASCPNGTILAKGSSFSIVQGMIRFSNNGVFLSAEVMTPPAPDLGFADQAPQPISDHSGHVFGVWFTLSPDGGGDYHTSLVQIDPDTLVQTELCRDFQPLVGGDIPFIPNTWITNADGTKFYYQAYNSNQIGVLDIATCVTTLFATAPTGYTFQPITDVITANAASQIFVVWTKELSADNESRLVVYDPDGSTFADIDFNDELQMVTCAPDPGSDGVWVTGVRISDSVQELRHYTLPGGVNDVTIDVPTPSGATPGNSIWYELHSFLQTECELECGPSNGLTITGVALDVDNLVIKAPDGSPATFDIVSSSITEIIVNNLVPELSAGEWCIAFTPGIPSGSLVASDGSSIWFTDWDGTYLQSPPSNPSATGFSVSWGGLLAYIDGIYILLDRNEGQHIYDEIFDLLAVQNPTNNVLGAGTNHSDSYYVLNDNGTTTVNIEKRDRLDGTLTHTYPTNFYPDLSGNGQIAVSPDGNSAYLATAAPAFTNYYTKIQKYNLAAETGPTVWVTGTDQGGGIDTLFPSNYGPGIITLRNGQVLAVWNDTTTGLAYIAQYDPDGTEVIRYPFPVDTVPQAINIANDDLSFIVISGVGLWTYGLVQRVQVSDGDVIQGFIVPPFDSPLAWSNSVIALIPIWINEWTCCVTCGSGPGSPTVTSVDVSGACSDPTLTINGTDLIVDDLVIKGPDDLPVTFNVVSSSGTQIIIDSLSPAFTDGEYCFGFEPDTYPFCFDLVCATPTVTSVAANCSEDPITLNITGTNMVSADLVIKGPDDLPVTFSILYDTPELIKVGSLSPAFNSGEYCFGFEPATYPFCFTVTCTPTITTITANCDEDPITISLVGTGMISADLVVKGPDDLPVTFVVITDSVTLIKIGTLVPEFVNGEYCFGFAPATYPFCDTLVCFALLSGIYFLDPTATHDTLYVSFDPVVTTTVKIP